MIVALSTLAALAPASAGADVLSWTQQKIDDHAPYFDTTPLGGAACTSSSFCIAVGSTGRADYSSDPTGGSSAWEPEQIDPNGGLDGISCLSDGSVCVAVDSEGAILGSANPTGGGSAWAKVDTNASGTMRGVSCYSTSFCLAVGNDGEAYSSSTPATTGSWTGSDIDGTNLLTAVSCPTAAMCVAVDNEGNAITSTNLNSGTPTWQVQPIDVDDGGLWGVSCPDTTVCVAADANGNVVRSLDPGAASPTWTKQDVDASQQFLGISCPTETLCVGVDIYGEVVTSANPAAPTPAWTATTVDPAPGQKRFLGVACISAPLCLAVDEGGYAVTSTNPTAGAGAWSGSNVEGTTRLDQGSCPSTTFCAIPDRIGKILTSTNPTGGSGGWTANDVDGSLQLFQISCPNTSFCAGIDENGNVLTSTDPTDGASATWTSTSIDSHGNYPHGISCVTSPPSTVLCVAVDELGGIITSTNPAGGVWSSRTVVDPVTTGLTLFRVDCPTTTLCVAVDEQGNVVTSTDPLDGASANWTVTNVDSTRALFSIDCQSSTLCVAGDQHGYIVTSTNPAGGASAWATPVNIESNSLFGIACPSATYCIATDNAGYVVTSTDPTGGSAAWSSFTKIGDNFGALGAMCPSTSLCVVPEHSSDIAVGTQAGPDVVTNPATNLMSSTATLNGTVDPEGTTVTDCHFDYGTTTSYGSTAPCVETVGDGTTNVSVHADLTGLKPNTPYYFRLEATNGGGVTHGDGETFTTSAIAPTVIAGAASNVSAHGAVLQGTVNPNNSTITDCHFEYGTTTMYGTSAPCAQTVGGGGTAVVVSAVLSGLDPNTPYDFELVATNGAGSDSDTGTFTTVAIDTLITSGPDGPTNDSSPSFTFTADPDAMGTTFECSVDHATPSSCQSPLATGKLPDGQHDVEVIASTPGGVADPTPAFRDFFVDTKPPVTSVSFAPAPNTGSIRIGSGDSFSGPVEITPSASDPDPGSGVAEIRCDLDPASAPGSFDALPVGCVLVAHGVGSHVVYVASRDAAGNLELPSAHSFTILPAPDTTITAGPDGPTWDSGPGFSFSSTIPGSTFRCRMDGGPFTPLTNCTNPYLSAALASGQHTFEVVAVSPDGVADPTPASRTFSVNAPQSNQWECHIAPYLALSPALFLAHPGGCDFSTNGDSCDSAYYDQCIPIDATCPVGALCTLTIRASFDNADQNAKWVLGGSASAYAPANPTTPVGSSSGSSTCTQIANSPPHCQSDDTTTLIGSGNTLNYETDTANFATTGATTYGPDSSRHFDAYASLSIKPAPPLATVFDGGGLQILAPGAGTLLVNPIGGLGHSIRATAAAKAKPVFKSIRERVKHAGVIELTLQLSSAAARAYKHHHKLTIHIRETFQPTHGKTIIKNIKIKLTTPPPTLAQQCAANRHLRNSKTCKALRRHKRQKRR